MDNVARLHRPLPAAEHASGHVVEARDGAFTVRVRGELVTCARAASCLLEPVRDDRVVVFREGEAAWVLAVLARAAGTASDVVLEGDATLRSRDGTVTVSAPQGVRLESPTEVRAVTARLRVAVDRADLLMKRVLAAGQAVEAQVGELRTHAGRLDQVIGHLTQSVRSALRTVDDTDTLRAKRVDYRAEQAMTLHGDAAVLTAREVVKVDGAQIQLG
jgi:hypothetical protein